MDAITREEKILAGESLTPITREEMFLAKAAGQAVSTPEPITRKEMFLSRIQGGGGSGEAKNTLNEYLLGTKTDITAEDLAGVTTLRENFLIKQPITSIEFPASVTVIGNYAFSGCTHLTSVVIPETITGFGARIFEQCSGLVSVILPKNMKAIATWMFISCTSLPSIVIPQSVSTISDRAFASCVNLREVICLPETPPELNSTGFYGVPADCIFKVKPTSVEAYKAETNWSVRADYIVALTEEEMAQYGD